MADKSPRGKTKDAGEDAGATTTLDEREVTRAPITDASNGALAKAPEQSRAVVQSEYDDEDLGAGLKDLTQDDLQIPFYVILQKGSPQVEEDNPRYVKGAKPGVFMNTVTNRIIDGKVGMRIVPVARIHNYIEWVPRDDGGGLVAVHDLNAPEVAEALKKAGRKFGKIKIGDNNDLVETFNVFSMVLNEDGTFEHAMLGFSSTQIGRYKRLMTRANSIQIPVEGGRSITPPLFSHVYRVRTEFVSKNEYTWYKYLIDFDGPDAKSCRLAKDNPLFLAAKEFRKMIESGKAQADFKSAQNEDGAGAEQTYEM